MDKILRSKASCPPKFFPKTKIIHKDHEKNVKKNQKNPCTDPVPGPKVIFTAIFTLKKYLSPGTGSVPGFF